MSTTTIRARVLSIDPDFNGVPQARAAMLKAADAESRTLASEPSLVRRSDYGHGLTSLDYEAETAPL